MRRIALAAACLIATALAACTTPTPTPPADPTPAASSTPAARAPSATPARDTTGRTSPTATPPPAAATRKPTLSGERTDTSRAVLVNRSCRTDADCTVKDVGSCCGTYPACVNVASPTDPRAVQLECARTGMASTCEVPVIDSCTCSNGQCAASTAVTR